MAVTKKSRRATPKKPPKHFLSAAQVCQRYGGVSHMWLERRLANDDFPPAFKLGRLRFFDEAAIEAWERQRAAKAGD